MEWRWNDGMFSGGFLWSLLSKAASLLSKGVWSQLEEMCILPSWCCSWWLQSWKALGASVALGLSLWCMFRKNLEEPWERKSIYKSLENCRMCQWILGLYRGSYHQLLFGLEFWVPWDITDLSGTKWGFCVSRQYKIQSWCYKCTGSGIVNHLIS